MTKKKNRIVLKIDKVCVQHNYQNPADKYNKLFPFLLPIPTKEDKKFVLDSIENPNFEKYYYFPKSVFKGLENFFRNEEAFIKIEKRRKGSYGEAGEVLLDSKNQYILGTYEKPFKIYTPPIDRGIDYWKRGEIIPYVYCHSDGTIIIKVLEKIIESCLPDNISEETIILLFQWKHENPTKQGYHVNPRKIRLSTLIQHVLQK